MVIRDVEQGHLGGSGGGLRAGHGGGDDGLATQFVQAVGAVKDGRMSVEEAQKKFIGCTLEEVVQSHAMVFAAEEARKQRVVVDWPSWWQKNVEEGLQQK